MQTENNLLSSVYDFFKVIIFFIFSYFVQHLFKCSYNRNITNRKNITSRVYKLQKLGFQTFASWTNKGI